MLDVVIPAGFAGESEIVVDSNWFDRYPGFSKKFGDDRAAAILKRNGKVGPNNCEGYVWQDYVAGTDPTDESDTFKVFVAIVEGRPVITCYPKLNPEDAAKRRYTTLGKVSLDEDQWAVVPQGREHEYRFFKVAVEMR